MAFENCYVSANCNATPTIAHWGRNNLICYGSCNAVLIYDPNVGCGGKVVDTLVSHKNRVNSVRWIHGDEPETEVVSGSSDGTAIVWTNTTYAPFILKGHTSNINIVDGLYKASNQRKTVISTASMDTTVKVWYREHLTDEFILSENLEFGHSICVGMRLTLLPDTNTVLLACALDSYHIQLFVESHTKGENASIKLVKSARLVGHEDWVRGLDFTINGRDILLASSSQDGFIRLWRLAKDKPQDGTDGTYRTPLTLVTPHATYNIQIESVIPGHDGWIYSVQWNPQGKQLLSASIDKTMVIWERDPDAQMWTEKARLGEVGGNTLGFYGGFFGPDGVHICGHSYHGAFHMWRNDPSSSMWQPLVTVGGHFGEVVDLAWEPDGEFLLSVSSDQTCRVHAPWHKEVEPITWHELARPQVHGYDLYSLAVLSRYKYVSSAEEKVIRAFHAPKNFVENFRRICQFADYNKDIKKDLDNGVPEGASVPSLGLSNKAVYGTDNETDCFTSKKDPYPAESRFTSVQFEEPPTEETLLENTLWPEVQKLYGHGYEVYCLGASNDGKLLASACKSTTKQHAAIILWDTEQWKKIQELVSHTLTVVQIVFSPDDQHILSVSRDRRWSLFRRQPASNEYSLVATTDKATGIHTRIIWSCAWTHDSKYFTTGSREGKVVVWTRNENKETTNCLGQYEKASDYMEHKNESVTALAFAPMQLECAYLLAVGFEAGKIVLYSWNTEKFVPLLMIPEKSAHHLAVKRLAFRPVLGKAGYREIDENVLQLASCSSDHSVRIYNLFINTLLKS